MSLNRAVLVGNIVRDLELRKTTNGKSVVNFTVALNSYNGETSFIDCVAWNKSAEFITSYGSKGDRVGIDGRLQQRSYEKQDGTKANIVEVVADQIELLSNKKDVEVIKTKEQSFDTGSHMVVDVDNDLPF